MQIDTISVIARAHHHVLQTRVPDYAEDYLKTLEEEERVIFEYWAHAAAYLPIADYRYSLARKEEFLTGDGHWFKKDSKLMSYVLDRIKREGPLMSRDFNNPDKKKGAAKGMDWARNPVNLALRQLFMEGKIMVSGRKGFQKTYDLPERIIPHGIDQSLPGREEYFRYLIKRDIRAHGLGKAGEIAYLLKNTGKEVRLILKKMVMTGELTEVKVEGRGPEAYFVRPESLENFPSLKRKRKLMILSPFDNLVIQRKRLEELFGFKYVLECYVPAAKRKVGYFSLPLLWGAEFVGQVDLKADRKKRVLLVKKLVWEEKIKNCDHLLGPLVESLKNFASFNQCDSVAVLPEVKKHFGSFL